MDSIKQALTKVKQSFGSRDDLSGNSDTIENRFLENTLEKSTFVDIDVAADRNLQTVYVYDDVFRQEDTMSLKTQEQHSGFDDSSQMDGPSTSELFSERIEKPRMGSLQTGERTIPSFPSTPNQDDHKSFNYIYDENKYKKTRNEMRKSITSTLQDSMATRGKSPYDTMGFYFTGQKYFRELNGKFDKIETRSYQMKSLLSMQCSDTQTPVVHGPPKVKCRLEDSVVRMEIVPLVANTKTSNTSNKSIVIIKDESDHRQRHDIQYVVYPWRGVTFEKPTVRPPCRIHVAVK